MLDNYFRKQVSHDVKRKLSACFVLSEKETNRIKGYYTLSTNSISNEWIPEVYKKKLPSSYTSIPTILLGRLAVEKSYQGSGIGAILLIVVLKRCFEISDSVGAFAVIVGLLNISAGEFYLKHGFIKLPDSGKMFSGMKTVRQLFGFLC